MSTMAKGMASGGMWMKEVLGIAQGLPRQYKGRGGSTAGGAANARRAEQTKAMTTLNDIGEKWKAEKDPAKKAELEQQFDSSMADAQDVNVSTSQINLAREHWGLKPVKLTQKQTEAATKDAEEADFNAQQTQLAADIDKETDPAKKTEKTKTYIGTAADRAYEKGRAASKGRTPDTGLNAAIEAEPTPLPDNEINSIKLLGPQLLEGNPKMAGSTAYMVLKAAFDPNTRIDLNRANNMLVIGDLGEFAISSKMLENINGIRNAKRAAQAKGLAG
jgi:chemotaxis protein histidine kinase CheA